MLVENLKEESLENEPSSLQNSEDNNKNTSQGNSNHLYFFSTKIRICFFFQQNQSSSKPFIKRDLLNFVITLPEQTIKEHIVHILFNLRQTNGLSYSQTKWIIMLLQSKKKQTFLFHLRYWKFTKQSNIWKWNYSKQY